MEKYIPVILIIYTLLAIISAALTVYDKSAAKLNKQRIPEKTLIIAAACGGALPMLITMKSIRHKTRHKKFMLGLPAIILLHIAIIVVIVLVTL